MLKRLMLIAILIVNTEAAGVAWDWPHWRGPTGDGVSEETGLPTNWSTTENVYWKVDLPGRSGATPIISGDRIFVTVTEGTELGLWALDRATGSQLWTQPLGSGNERLMKGNRANPSPVTDGESVWVLTGTGLLRRFDMDGNEIWMHNIQEKHGEWGLLWGYGSSPLLDGDDLYVQVLHGFYTDDPSYIVKIDKETGDTLWRVERPTDAIRESPDSYTTPVIIRTDW